MLQFYLNSGNLIL